MRRFILIVCILVTGCAQLSQGQIQPVIVIDKKENILATNCGGAVETWGSCYQKAKAVCSSGFGVINRDENSTGTLRKLTFKCK